MATTSAKTDSILTQFAGAIDKAIEESVRAAYDRHMEAFKREAEEIKADVIANAVMRMSSWYNFQDLGHTLRIEVKNPESKAQPGGNDEH
jgi:hypothetical protein